MRATVLVAAAALVGCGGGERVTLNVRTAFPEELREAVELSFEADHPDIDLRFSDAPKAASVSALEAGKVDFDVWWGAPASALARADRSGVFAPSSPVWASALGPGPSSWHPWLTTPLVVAFDRTVVALADAPTDWIDVFHHSWFDDVRVPDPAGTEAGAALVGAIVVEALRDDDDLNRGFDWLARLHDQVDVYTTTSDEAIAALRTGDALVAVMPRADAEIARAGDAPWLHYRIPASGTPELVLGVGIVAGSESVGAARAFLDHIGSDEMATAAKRTTHWEPVAGEVDETRLPAGFELPQRWVGYAPAFDTLAAELKGWIERWEREIRTR